MNFTSYLLADVYSSGSYNSSIYNGSGSSGTTSNTSASILTNTGFDIATIVTIACVISLIAVIVRFWRKPKHTPSSE